MKTKKLADQYELGKYGEEMAVRFLKKKRYHIIARNYRFGGGELDIVARHGNKLVFVEVKTRTSQRFGRPIEAMTRQKIQHFIKTATHFCQKFHLNDFDLRLDVIEILITPRRYFINSKKITHHQNAIQATD